MEQKENEKNRRRKINTMATKSSTVKAVGFVDLSVSLFFVLFLVHTIILPLITLYRNVVTTEWMLMTLLVITVAILLTPSVALLQVAYLDPWSPKAIMLFRVWVCMHWMLVPCFLGWGVTCFLQENLGPLEYIIFSMYAWFKLFTICIIHCRIAAGYTVIHLREERVLKVVGGSQ